MSLPKANRLRGKHNFDGVYQSGYRRKGNYINLLAVRPPQVEQQPSSLGISISQKVSKKAVVRNRIKRRLKAAFRSLLPEIKPGYKIVLVVKPEACVCEYEHFLRELKELLIKAEIINGH